MQNLRPSNKDLEGWLFNKENTTLIFQVVAAY